MRYDYRYNSKTALFEVYFDLSDLERKVVVEWFEIESEAQQYCFNKSVEVDFH